MRRSKEPISPRYLHTHWEGTQLTRRRDGDRCLNAFIPSGGFLVLLFCEEIHGLTFSLIEASLNVGVSRLFCRVLEEKFSLMLVPSGGREPSRAMPSAALVRR